MTEAHEITDTGNIIGGIFGIISIDILIIPIIIGLCSAFKDEIK